MPWSNRELQEFAVLLLGIGEVFNEPVSEMRVDIYQRALDDLPFAAVVAAARTHVRRSSYFPKPAELREGVEGNTADAAELAWQWLLREVRRVGYVGVPAWPDGVTQQATEGLFGGWRALCERLPAEGPELLGFRKQFVSLFGATARRAVAGELGPSRDEAATLLEHVTAHLKSGAP